MEVVNRGEMIVAGVFVQAPWRRLWEEAPKAWRQLFARADELETLRVSPYMDVSLGVCRDEYLQLLGVQIRDGNRIPTGLSAVHIPAQQLLSSRCAGPVANIANAFGAMYAWGDVNGLKLSEFKLDIGYTPTGDETGHDLYVGLQPEAPWRRLNDHPS